MDHAPAIATTDRVPGVQTLCRLARNRSAWTIDEAVHLAGGAGLPMLDAAIEEIERVFAPVPMRPVDHVEWRAAMGVRLNAIAAKIAPTMPADQALEWRNAVTSALDDLPAKIALTAAKRALRVPIRFMAEVDGVIRSLAADVRREWDAAAIRLRGLRAEATRTTDSLPAGPDDDRPMTLEEIRALPPALRRIGLARGWISREQSEAACMPALVQG